MAVLEAALLETAGAWEKDGRAAGEVRESIGAVDETFLPRMMLVFMDLPTGYLLLEDVAAEWRAWATDRVKALQRASSAVEGRNSSLSHTHHQQRGLPKRRDKVWTVLHNFDGHAADGTTPASRFFRRSFPDLFATVFSSIEVLPQPRQRKDHGARSP